VRAVIRGLLLGGAVRAVIRKSCARCYKGEL